MKKRLFYLVTLVALGALCFNSCKNEPYSSGEYQYIYYLINNLSDTVIIKQSGSLAPQSIIAPGDSLIYLHYGCSYQTNDIMDLQRPTLEQGYDGTINNNHPTTLVVNNREYNINTEQENSFMICKNYLGMQDSVHVFIFNYYFYINHDYISSLQEN